MVIFSKIDFVLNNKIVYSVNNTTLPNAIELAKEFKPIENYKMVISCYY